MKNTPAGNGIRAVVFEPTPFNQSTIPRIVRAVVERVDVTRTPSDLHRLTQDLCEGDIIVVNLDGASPEVQQELAHAIPRQCHPWTIAISSQDWSKGSLAAFLGPCRVQTLLGWSPRRERELFVCIKKLVTHDSFGLAKYFGWGTEFAEFSLTESGQRPTATSFAESFAVNTTAQTRISSHVATVADELLSNAIYNAPVDENLQRTHVHVDRLANVPLGPGQEIILKVGADGMRIGLSVEDRFGSLSASWLRDHLFQGPSRSVSVRNSTGSGSGIGLLQTLRSASHLIFNIEDGVRTEVLALFEIVPSYKTYATMPRSVSIFSCGESVKASTSSWSGAVESLNTPRPDSNGTEVLAY